ncbi:thiamine pyrophosphate-binding protein [Streptomyces sp. NPDC051362]|uniref:thiamine pyrophosphate-binding protein n=1 Tax=Streptomyces sp. NPDC051362 TaxID=3365651 RepID=UPI0037B52CC2
MMTEKHTGASLLAAAIKSAETLVFGMVGGHNLVIFAELQKAGVPFYQGRHEQGAGFMAEGYGRLTGAAPVLLTTAGPGITNVVTPIAQAYAESVPMVVLAVDNYASTIATPMGRFHGIPDLQSILSPISTWMGTADSPEELYRLVRRALNPAEHNRPMPRVIHVPSNVLAATAMEPVAPEGEEDLADDASLDGDVDRLLELLAQAERPVILAGAGSVRAQAAQQVQDLAERLHAPVVTTVQARGLIPDDHALAAGTIWDRYASLDGLAAEADLTLCLGTSLSPLATRDGTLPLKNIFQVDLAEPLRATTYEDRQVARQDVKRFVERLLERLSDGLKTQGVAESYARKVKQASQDRWVRLTERSPIVAGLLEGIREASPRETVFSCDMTMFGYWAQRFLPVHTPGGLLSPYYFGTLGYGIPAAIGAAIAKPGQPVVALCGDGGALMNFQEFAAVQRFGVPVHAVVFNDSAFGAMRADVRRQGTGEVDVVDLWNPDFADLARAYGLQYAQTGPQGADVRGALSKQIEKNAPSLLEVKISDEIPIFYEVDLR